MKNDIASVSSIPKEIDPADLLRGKGIDSSADLPVLELHPSSGESRSDIIEGVVTIFHEEFITYLNDFGIEKVPSVVVLRSKATDMFVMEYHGAINANVTAPTTENTFFLKTAIDALLAKRPFSVTEGNGRGCDF